MGSAKKVHQDKREHFPRAIQLMKLTTYGSKEICDHHLNLLVEVFDTLFIAGNTVVRSFSSGKDEKRHFSPAEANSSRKLNLNIVRLLIRKMQK